MTLLNAMFIEGLPLTWRQLNILRLSERPNKTYTPHITQINFVQKMNSDFFCRFKQFLCSLNGRREPNLIGEWSATSVTISMPDAVSF